MKITLSNLLAEEVRHKLNILADERDLQEDYDLSQEQADALLASVCVGEWEVPDWALAAVRGELADHAEVLRRIADSHEREGNHEAAREVERTAARINRLAEPRLKQGRGAR